MEKLRRKDLMTLEAYAEARPWFRARIMAHKKDRRVAIGDHASLYFEDRLTIQYQVQEMLRAEKIFAAPAIDEELAAYNPLIPDGSNWKATFMLEYPNREERLRRCRELVGIEDRVWVRVGDGERLFAIADEDLPRATDEKTSTVHFLRFELRVGERRAVAAGAPVRMGIDHAGYRCEVILPDAVRRSLSADLG